MSLPKKLKLRQDRLAAMVASQGQNRSTCMQQVQSLLNVLQAQAPQLWEISTLIADTGYCSDNNVNVCEGAKVVLLIAVT